MRLLALSVVVSLASAESAATVAVRTSLGFLVGFGFLAVGIMMFYTTVRSFKWTKKAYAILKTEGTVAQVQVSNKLHYSAKSGNATTTRY